MRANVLKIYVCVLCVCGIGAKLVLLKWNRKSEKKVSWLVVSGCWCSIITPIGIYDICFTLLFHIFSKVSQLGIVFSFSDAYFSAHSCLWFGFFLFHYSIFLIFNLIIFLSSSLSLNRHPMRSTRNQPRLNSLVLVNWSSAAQFTQISTLKIHVLWTSSTSLHANLVRLCVCVCVYNQPCFSISCGYSFAFLSRFSY